MAEELPSWIQYVNALGPGLIFLGAVIASIVAGLSLHHRRKQDRKDEWWRRTQWALEQTLRDSTTAKDVGLNVLALQADSKYGDDEDALIIDAVAEDVLDDYLSAPGDAAPKQASPRSERLAQDEYDESSLDEENER